MYDGVNCDLPLNQRVILIYTPELSRMSIDYL